MYRVQGNILEFLVFLRRELGILSMAKECWLKRPDMIIGIHNDKL